MKAVLPVTDSAPPKEFESRRPKHIQVAFTLDTLLHLTDYFPIVNATRTC